MENIKILFVCMGNICRSPTAEGLFRELLSREGLVHRVEVDSAGTHAYHVGHCPDHRAQKTARNRGIDISDLRARRIAERDFEHYDYIVAMDRDNYRCLEDICPPQLQGKLRLLLHYAPHLQTDEVPDPYYGGASGFERVIDVVDAGLAGLLDEIRKRIEQTRPAPV